MSDRAIVALGATLLLLVLIATVTVGSKPSVYAGAGAIVAVAALVVHLIRRRRI